MTSGVLTVLIVDDEPLARQVAREYVEQCPGVRVVGESANGFEAIRAVSDAVPDILLLDVQMPKLSGFDVLELVGQGPAVIFATAHDEFALRAFEVHAVDYLLKPFSQARLADALERARRRIAAGEASPADDLRATLRKSPIDRVLVRDGHKIHVVPVQTLDYVQAQDDYVMLHAGERRLLKEQPLSSLEAQLDPSAFVRVHRSYLVNLTRIARIELEAKDRRVAVLHTGERLPVSRSGAQRLHDRL
jgi:two-component system, LytTR family, response regulator